MYNKCRLRLFRQSRRRGSIFIGPRWTLVACRVVVIDRDSNRPWWCSDHQFAHSRSRDCLVDTGGLFTTWHQLGKLSHLMIMIIEGNESYAMGTMGTNCLFVSYDLWCTGEALILTNIGNVCTTYLSPRHLLVKACLQLFFQTLKTIYTSIIMTNFNVVRPKKHWYRLNLNICHSRFNMRSLF